MAWQLGVSLLVTLGDRAAAKTTRSSDSDSFRFRDGKGVQKG